MGKLGRVLFAIPLVVFGLQYLVHGHLAGGLPPLPPWTPGGVVSAYLAGCILLIAGILLLANQALRITAIAIGFVFLASVMILHVQHLHDVIYSGIDRTRALEPLALAGAAYALGALASSEKSSVKTLTSATPGIAVFGRYIFVFSIILLGVQHFIYAQFVATLVPAWMPGHLFLTYLTGIGMIATGLAIATGVLSRLASVLLGIMFLIIFVTLHVPRVLAHIHNADELTSAFVALGFAGASFIFAAYLSSSH